MSNDLPIIYVRGYAMTQDVVESAVNLPYYGFNQGSTKIRAGVEGDPEFFIFESPLVRLMKEYKYTDYFVRCENGKVELLKDIEDDPVPRKSLWIYRYYDITSEEIGDEDRKEMEYLADNLEVLVDYVLEQTGAPKVHLVAHSMGGLICRSVMQNKWKDQSVNKVSKFFTYGTPHKGIDFRRGLGWAARVRDVFGVNESDVFGPGRMREYLDLDGDELNSLEGHFPPERVFCMIGTNRKDYRVAKGASQWAVGPDSDGLVQISNAYVKNSSRGFAFRSHSGTYGIVNSEEGYQNLQRFLFGDTSIQFDLANIKIADNYPDRDTLKYLLLETEVCIAGDNVLVTEQLEEHGSTVKTTPSQMENGSETLFRTFLMKSKRGVEKSSYSHLQIRINIIPKHVKNRRLRRSRRYFGECLFSNTLTIGVSDLDKNGIRKVRYAWGALDADIVRKKGVPIDGVMDIPIVESKRNPRWIDEGALRISVRSEHE